jgi:hypothetical protein
MITPPPAMITGNFASASAAAASSRLWLPPAPRSTRIGVGIS